MRTLKILVATILVLAPFFAQAADITHLQWESLSIVTGKTVMLLMPGGPVVTGKVTGIDSDALILTVSKTSDAKACPKGVTRVPRATLHVLQLRSDGKAYRALLAIAGGAVGLTASVIGAAVADWHGNHDDVVRATVVAGGVGGAVAGYFAGRKTDQHWATIEIVQ